MSAQSTTAALVNGNNGQGVACNNCLAVYSTAQQAATCLCKRRRYITTLAIRYGKFPTTAQLQGLNASQATKVVNWYNSRLKAAQQANGNAAPAAHQVRALNHLGIPVPATAGAADAALIAYFKSSAATSAAVWQLAGIASAPQPQQLTLF